MHFCLAWSLMLFFSTIKSDVSTPTAPPQNEATIGSTSASCGGRWTPLIKSAYDLPPMPSLTWIIGATSPPNRIIAATVSPYRLVYSLRVFSFTGGKKGMNDGYDSSSALLVPFLIRCWIRSLLTSSMSKKILFCRDWMFISSSLFCISLNDLTLSLLSMMQKFSGSALKSSSCSPPASPPAARARTRRLFVRPSGSNAGAAGVRDVRGLIADAGDDSGRCPAQQQPMCARADAFMGVSL
mmetsp:Transcript_11686/g.32982  ORF Transcript_11686/g.32982 Transcript_11686/m.32982 type:complete len:240 (-) Transcript_11686:197-916(-)